VAVVQEVHDDIRDYILGARVTAYANPGFLPVLQQHLLRFSEHYGLRAELIAPPDWNDEILEPTVEAQLLRIIQEALTNARKHAQAQCVQVHIQLDENMTQVTIKDNGMGFDPAQLLGGEGQKYGLRFMRERAEEVGGSLEIHSILGEGTEIVVLIPVRDRHETVENWMLLEPSESTNR
jgi:signal transduction histidine kinase